MKNNLNSVIVEGVVGKVEPMQTGGGTSFIAFDVAVSRYYKVGEEIAHEVSLFDVTPLDSSGQVLVFRSALHIRTCQHGLCRGLCVILRSVVPSGQEVANSTAVAGDQSFESPFIAQDLLLVACL